MLLDVNMWLGNNDFIKSFFVMKKIILSLFVLMLAQSFYAQEKIWEETEDEKTERLSWWIHDRFGMFIHWGLYAQPARHEWVKKREHISDEDYQKYFDMFDPDLFEPTEWARKAKAAGMKYAVITTKHHEGFCMFDSKYTDYDVMSTPYGKDVVKEWVEAFRAEGLGVGFYYSLIDWHHPQFTIDTRHSIKASSDKEFKELNKGRDMAIYREYMKNQVEELMTNYGKIDMLWLDFSYPGKNGKGREEWGSVDLLKMVRNLQPGIIVNDRLDLKDYEGGWDFTTPEQFKVEKWPEINGKKVPWETCQTFSGSWGYNRDELTWKNNKQLLVLLIESVSKGGNLLLNVGPTARGTFDYRADDALAGMGDWMKFNSASIYGCTEAPQEYVAPANTILTYNQETNRLYVHLLDYPMQNLLMPGFNGKVKYARFLHDASEIQLGHRHGAWGKEETKAEDLYLKLPVNKPNIEIPVIEIFLEK